MVRDTGIRPQLLQNTNRKSYVFYPTALSSMTLKHISRSNREINLPTSPCPHKKRCQWFFHNNFYKYARIFMVFGTQLCKWILIILVNLLRRMPCTSLTWWRNADVTEIMPFTVHVTLSPCCRETPRVYPSRDVAIQFARFESGGLQHLGYTSREGLPFADPWCEGVERTSAESSGGCWTIPSSLPRLRSGVVVWMHVFA